jgi:hypothetical protein
MNQQAQACLQKAEECERSAQRTKDESARLLYLDLANHGGLWLNMSKRWTADAPDLSKANRTPRAPSGASEVLQRRVTPFCLPIISDVEGFMAYYVVYAPDDTVTAISIFKDFAGADESNRRALAWIEQSLAPLLVGPATAIAGPVIVHTLA